MTMIDRYRLLEPGIYEVYGEEFPNTIAADELAATISIAISLRRLADMMQVLHGRELSVLSANAAIAAQLDRDLGGGE